MSGVGSLDLRLPLREQRLLSGLLGPWSDLLYVPGPGLTSPVDAGLCRSSFFAVPATGPAVRISSLAMPAFGADLCRIRVEPVAAYRAARLGSMFDPSRQGLVYTIAADRRRGPTPPDRPEWRYGGPPLAERLGAVTRVRLLRERVRSRAADQAFGWEADRGLVVSGPEGAACLFLAEPHDEEQVAFFPGLGLHRALVEGAAGAAPGASPRELLGYGEWGEQLEVDVALVGLASSSRDGASS
jgi:hypothetical protein